MTDLLKVMEREMLCSEHAAQCFVEATRRQTARRKAERSNCSGGVDQREPVPVSTDEKTQ